MPRRDAIPAIFSQKKGNWVALLANGIIGKGSISRPG
jgi:hypothetical protein